MEPILPKVSGSVPRVIADIELEMIKADLRKSENDALRRELGICLESARQNVGWTLDRLARELPPPTGSKTRDPRQVRRWCSGEEAVQLEVVFAVKEMRLPFVTALANLAGARVRTHIDFERSA